MRSASRSATSAGQQAAQQRVDFVVGDGRLGELGQVAVQPQGRRVAGDQVQVGGVGLDGTGQPVAETVGMRDVSGGFEIATAIGG